MPPLVMRSSAVDHHSPFLPHSCVFIAETSEPASGSVTANAPSRLLDGAEAGGSMGDLLGVPGEDRGDREPVPWIASAIPAQPQSAPRRPGGHDAELSAIGLLKEVDPVEADLGRLLTIGQGNSSDRRTGARTGDLFLREAVHPARISRARRSAQTKPSSTLLYESTFQYSTYRFSRRDYAAVRHRVNNVKRNLWFGRGHGRGRRSAKAIGTR